MVRGWYYVESLTGQRHDRVQTGSQIATVDRCFDLVGSLQHGVASCEVFSWSTDIHKPTICRWWWPQMKLKSFQSRYAAHLSFIDIFQTNCYLQVKKWRKEILKHIYNSLRLTKYTLQFIHSDNDNDNDNDFLRIKPLQKSCTINTCSTSDQNRSWPDQKKL